MDAHPSIPLAPGISARLTSTPGSCVVRYEGPVPISAMHASTETYAADARLSVCTRLLLDVRRARFSIAPADVAPLVDLLARLSRRVSHLATLTAPDAPVLPVTHLLAHRGGVHFEEMQVFTGAREAARWSGLPDDALDTP